MTENINNTLFTGTINSVETWMFTGDLRFLKTFTRGTMLQQRWINTLSGMSDWRDVPMVFEGQENS